MRWENSFHYGKAFSTVCYKKLQSVMEEKGYPAHLIKITQSIYHIQNSLLTRSSEQVRRANTNRGVKQGCPLLL